MIKGGFCRLQDRKLAIVNHAAARDAMRTLVAVFLVVAAQAIDGYNIKPRFSYKSIEDEDQGGRIAGGEYATPGQFPFQVGMFLDETGFCGGSLISDSVVLTAGHCCESVSNFEVHLGAHNIYDGNEPNHQIITTTDSQTHEDYNATALNNDICIVRLGQSVSGSGIATVRLPSRSQSGDTFDFVIGISSGWGRPRESNPSISPVMKWVNLNITSNEKCEAQYGTLITSCHLCVDTKTGAEGICNGDNGGPLTITEGDGEKTQVAIASFYSSAGCQVGTPHGFCRVTCYLDWLEQNAGVTIRP